MKKLRKPKIPNAMYSNFFSCDFCLLDGKQAVLLNRTPLSLSETKRLYVWLGKAIASLEGKKESK